MVIDTSALLAILLNESDAPLFEEAIEKDPIRRPRRRRVPPATRTRGPEAVAPRTETRWLGDKMNTRARAMADGRLPHPDPVVERYKRDVDRTLIRENLKLSVEERLQRLMELQRAAHALREAGRAAARRR